MFKWRMKASNAIFLEDKNGQEGRPFKSRFLQAGLVRYDFGVCLLKKETIDKFINTFIECPVIIDHKDDISESDKVGVINNIWFSAQDGWFWCDGVITDEKAIKLIEDGYNVSCQYRITDYAENSEGKLHNANPYDKEILDGVFEHLAIVENPRYEDAFIAVNAYIAANKEFHEEDHPRDDEGKFSERNTQFGTAYSEFSNKPEQAIEHLLKEKKGYVPAAIHKEGIGDIDFIYGKGGKDGYGLAHIIEQRNKQGIDGVKLIQQIPNIIKSGTVISKDNHTDRKYVVSEDKEVAVRLDYDGEKRNWIVSTYIKNELPVSNSLNDWHTMLALDSNLNVANGYVSITTPVNNIITHSKSDFNPPVTINKATNKFQKVFDYIRNTKGESMDNETKGLFAALADALKARNEAEDKKEDEKEPKASNEDVDKRKLIDEVGGILKGKVDEEVWRTIIGKIEKVAYDKSEAGTADNSKAKNEEDEEAKKKAEEEKKKKEEEEARNKCRNEEEKRLYEELKEKVEKEAENKAKNSLNDAVNQLYAALAPAQDELYISPKKGLELGRKIYG